jgi:hypothetical protein
MWLGHQPNAISMNFYSRMINMNKSTVVSVQSAMVSQWFCVWPTSKRWFLKTVQVTMKHDPFDAMLESMATLHPPRIHILPLRWSLKRSVKPRIWTGSAFSTHDKSAWSVMVTGSQSRVSSGPYFTHDSSGFSPRSFHETWPSVGWLLHIQVIKYARPPARHLLHSPAKPSL